MRELTIKNERIKREYYKWLREARGFSESTINAIEKAICMYEDFTDGADLAKFNQRSAVGFKHWLQQRQISITTQYHYLRHLKTFFTWLSGQPGYKSKIGIDDISYLSLDRKKVQEATASKRVDCPSLEYVRKLADSIEVRNEIDQRDRALVAFLLQSGMRDSAVSSLPLGCFDHESLRVSQEPSKGVDTKFGKRIVTTLFRFDNQLVDYVLEWADYLKTEKCFSSAAPLFPRSKVEHEEGGLNFHASEVEPVFWRSAGRIRQILKNRAAKSGLPYFNPHSFRHSAVQLAMKRCRTAEEMKAVSQNLGHEYVGTTLTSYGKVDDYRVADLIRAIDFSSGSESADRSDIKEQIRRMLNDL